MMPLVAGLSVEGLVSRTVVDNYVCMVGWKDLQTQAYGPLIENNPIAACIQKFPKGNFRVRLNFGRYSPAFANALAGGSVMINDPQDGVNAAVPIWWQNLPLSLKLAQANLIARLADRYDGIVPCFFMGTNMTIYCEPFIRQIGDATTRQNLTNAAYTTVVDQQSYYDEMDMFSAFQQSRVAWSYNPYQTVVGGQPQTQIAFTLLMISEFRKRFPGGVVYNNSIRTPTLGGFYPQMYAAMKNTPPLGFQTATTARVGDYAKTLDWAVAQGAHIVELSPGYETKLTSKQLSYYDAALKANA